MQPLYPVSLSPHIHDGSSSTLIHTVLSAALIPSLIFGGWVFGFAACFKILGLGLITIALEWILSKCFRQPFFWRDGQAIYSAFVFMVFLPWPLSFQVGAIGALTLAILRVITCGSGLPIQPVAATLLTLIWVRSAYPAVPAQIISGWGVEGRARDFVANL